MKTFYETPEAEVINLQIEDIITTSTSLEEFDDMGDLQALISEGGNDS